MIIKQIEKDAIEALKNDDTDLCEKLIQEGVCPPEFAEAAWEKKIFTPSQLYENAPIKVRDEIIKVLEDDLVEDSLMINGLLMALSAIGDDVVVECFLRWEKDPKKWRDKLYVGPSEYALEGNWCIDKEEKRQLYFEESYAIVKTTKKIPSVFGGATRQECPFCHSSYQNILVLDGTETKAFFLKCQWCH